jgi:Holliday junction resolvasome RuvABC endonuclease subunit
MGESEEVKKYIYAFDLSMSNTGIAIFSNDGNLVHVESVATKTEKNHSGKLRLIANKVLGLKEKYPVEKIIIEGCFSRFNASTHAIYEVHGVIYYLFSEVDQILYQPMTVKKVVGGRGNMTKEEIRDVVLAKYPGWIYKNFDETDAVSVGDCYFIEKNKLNNIDLENQKRG